MIATLIVTALAQTGSISVETPPVRIFGLVVHSDVLLTGISLVLGAVLSIYVTVVYARYTHYSGLAREIAYRVEDRLIRAASPDTIRFSYEKTLPFIEAMQRISWDLLADGHVSAGREAHELKAFAQANGEALEAMLAKADKKQLSSAEFSSYQQKFDAYWTAGNFSTVAARIHPHHFAALSLLAKPVMSKQRYSSVRDYPMLP